MTIKVGDIVRFKFPNDPEIQIAKITDIKEGILVFKYEIIWYDGRGGIHTLLKLNEIVGHIFIGQIIQYDEEENTETESWKDKKWGFRVDIYYFNDGYWIRNIGVRHRELIEIIDLTPEQEMKMKIIKAQKLLDE